MNGSKISTPVTTSKTFSKKRELTSPDFPLDLKKNKLLEEAVAVKLPESDDSDLIDIPEIPEAMSEFLATGTSVEQPKSAVEPMHNITLGPVHMQAIAGVLQESIREELKQTIRDEIPGIVTPIVNGVVQGLKDQISRL